MKGLMKTSMILAALVLSASFAYAGDLKPVHDNNAGGGLHQMPTPNANAIANANENAAFNPDRDPGSDKDKVRKLRPVK
jgi:hypothetical protein